MTKGHLGEIAARAKLIHKNSHEFRQGKQASEILRNLEHLRVNALPNAAKTLILRVPKHLALHGTESDDDYGEALSS